MKNKKNKQDKQILPEFLTESCLYSCTFLCPRGELMQNLEKHDCIILLWQNLIRKQRENREIFKKKNILNKNKIKSDEIQ